MNDIIQTIACSHPCCIIVNKYIGSNIGTEAIPNLIIFELPSIKTPNTTIGAYP